MQICDYVHGNGIEYYAARTMSNHTGLALSTAPISHYMIYQHRLCSHPQPGSAYFRSVLSTIKGCDFHDMKVASSITATGHKKHTLYLFIKTVPDAGTGQSLVDKVNGG